MVHRSSSSHGRRKVYKEQGKGKKMPSHLKARTRFIYLVAHEDNLISHRYVLYFLGALSVEEGFASASADLRKTNGRMDNREKEARVEGRRVDAKRGEK
jgi:hypothetical protein